MPAKIIVKAHRGGSRVSLLGSSGKELLTSSVFKEPRAKGATLRALKGLLGDDVVVEDYTRASAKVSAAKSENPPVPAKTAAVTAVPTKRSPKKASTKPATRRPGRPRKVTAGK